MGIHCNKMMQSLRLYFMPGQLQYHTRLVGHLRPALPLLGRHFNKLADAQLHS